MKTKHTAGGGPSGATKLFNHQTESNRFGGVLGGHSAIKPNNLPINSDPPITMFIVINANGLFGSPSIVGTCDVQSLCLQIAETLCQVGRWTSWVTSCREPGSCLTRLDSSSIIWGHFWHSDTRGSRAENSFHPTHDEPGTNQGVSVSENSASCTRGRPQTSCIVRWVLDRPSNVREQDPII